MQELYVAKENTVLGIFMSTQTRTQKRKSQINFFRGGKALLEQFTELQRASMKEVNVFVFDSYEVTACAEFFLWFSQTVKCLKIKKRIKLHIKYIFFSSGIINRSKKSILLRMMLPHPLG